MPIYSLYWPPAHKDLSDDFSGLRRFFERLQLGYHDLRRRNGLAFWDGFVTRRSSYMQIECDIDHANPWDAPAQEPARA
jgi:hypothetical protein